MRCTGPVRERDNCWDVFIRIHVNVCVPSSYAGVRLVGTTEVLRGDADAPVLDRHLDLDLDWVRHTVTYLETRGELAAVKQNGTPVVAPGAEAALGEVVRTGVTLGVDEPGLVGTVLVDAPRALLTMILSFLMLRLRLRLRAQFSPRKTWVVTPAAINDLESFSEYWDPRRGAEISKKLGTCARLSASNLISQVLFAESADTIQTATDVSAAGSIASLPTGLIA